MQQPAPTEPKFVFVPMSVPEVGAPVPDIVKNCVRQYAEYLNTQVEDPDLKLEIPETNEDYLAVHPVTRFRALCWEVYGQAQLADGLILALRDCGLGVVVVLEVLDKPEEPSIILP